MALTHITDEARTGKGVTGLSDTPGLTTAALQENLMNLEILPLMVQIRHWMSWKANMARPILAQSCLPVLVPATTYREY